jgi:hypothetical protein
MLHGLGTSATSSTQDLSSIFKKLDANSDNSVSRDEFIVGKPDDVSNEQAGALFDTLDSSGKGAFSQDELTSAFQQMASSMQSVLLQAQEVQGGHHGHGGPPDPEKMFKDLDSNGDATLTRDEFVAGRPDDISEDQASAFYDKIASAAGADGAAGLSQDQLASGMKKAGPPDGAPQAAAAQTNSTQSSSSNDALLQELLKAIGSYQKANLLSVSNTKLAA